MVLSVEGRQREQPQPHLPHAKERAKDAVAPQSRLFPSFASCPSSNPSDILRTSEAESLSSRGCICVKEWLLRQSCHSCAVSRLSAFVVPAGIVDGDSVVPQR